MPEDSVPTTSPFHPRNTAGTREYKERTTYLRAAGFIQEADAREKYERDFQNAQGRIDRMVQAGMTPEAAQYLVDQSYTVDFAKGLREMIETLQPGREKSLALTKLDECEMWLARAPR